MSVTIREISVAASIASALPLIEEHYAETARNKHVMVLKPDVARYAAVEAQGMLIGLGAFDGDELVGYAVTLVTTHLHYADLCYASNDVLFVKKSHRSGRTGLQLIRETERIARARGAKMILWHSKPGTVLELLMQRRGYAHQDTIHSKEL